MLLSVVLSLTAESSSPILGMLGRAAQAWFLQQVTRAHPALASALHDEKGLKPYTLSTLLDEHGRPLQAGTWLKPGQPLLLRITTLTEEMSALVEKRIIQNLPRRLTLYKMAFRVDEVFKNHLEHAWAGNSSFIEIAQDAALAKAGNTLRLEFASPTAFRSNGLEIRLPLPGQVFRSLWAKWNAFCPEVMRLHDLWPQFAENCILVSEMTAVNTVHWVFSEGRRGVAGFTGTVGFCLPSRRALAAEWRKYADGAEVVMQSLARFAFYSGVGHHTTLGMGQVRKLA
jgi:CRISPR-associated endoribonuclease Cas6